MKRASPVLVFLLKALVSLGFLSFLLSRIDITQLLGVLSSVHLSYLVVALTGYFLGQIISSVRWTLLARPLGFENPFKDFVAFYLMIINLGLVAGLSGTLIPLTLKWLRFDPAIGSGVIVTTFTDIFGFLSFLGLATIFLR